MKIFNLIALLLGFICDANSQKLPEIQDKSVYLPANARVDGKTNEGFDKNIAMVTEIRFPVKQLVAENVVSKLIYTIKLNGIPMP